MRIVQLKTKGLKVFISAMHLAFMQDSGTRIKQNKGRKRTMTNYEKYAGSPERFAKLVIQMGCESGVGEELTRQFCQGGCGCDEGDVDCTEENLRQCIVTWLRETAR